MYTKALIMVMKVSLYGDGGFFCARGLHSCHIQDNKDQIHLSCNFRLSYVNTSNGISLPAKIELNTRAYQLNRFFSTNLLL